MLVKAAMSVRVEAITPDTTVQECARKMTQLDVGALPVSANGKVIGIVTDRDVCCRAVGAGRDTAATPVHEIMSKNVAYCFDFQDCDEAAQIMEKHRVRRLPVMNRENSVIGILTVDDLARYSHTLAGEVVDICSPWPH